MEDSLGCISLSSSSETSDSDVEILDSEPRKEDAANAVQEIKPKLQTSDSVKFNQCTITKVKDGSELDSIKIQNVTSLLWMDENGLSSSVDKTDEKDEKDEQRSNSQKEPDFIVNPKTTSTFRTEEECTEKVIKPSPETSDLELNNQFIVNPKKSFTVRTEIKTASNVVSTTTSFNDNQVETCSTLSSENTQESSNSQVTLKTKITNTNDPGCTSINNKKLPLSTKKYAKLTKLEPTETKKERKTEETRTGQIALSTVGVGKKIVSGMRNSSYFEESVKVQDCGYSDSDVEEVPMTDPLAEISSESEDNDYVKSLSGSDVSPTRKDLTPSPTKESLNPDEDIATIKRILLKAGFGKEGNMVAKRVSRYYDTIRDEIIKESDSLWELNRLTRIIQRTFDEKKDLKELAKALKEVMAFLKPKSTKEDRKLNHLYKLYRELEKRIKELEVKEVDSDSDENNSSYLILSKYKAKAVKVYKEICKIERISPAAGRQYLQKFNYRGVGPAAVQKALEKYFNKTRKFPNFSDVLRIINKVNSTENLRMSSVETDAMRIFEDFGRKLQKHRINDDRLLFSDYLAGVETDPALSNAELARKLAINKKLRKREEDVLDEYARKQSSRGTEIEEDKDSDSDEGDSQGKISDCDGMDHRESNDSDDQRDGEENTITIEINDDSMSSDEIVAGPSRKKMKS